MMRKRKESRVINPVLCVHCPKERRFIPRTKCWSCKYCEYFGERIVCSYGVSKNG